LFRFRRLRNRMAEQQIRSRLRTVERLAILETKFDTLKDTVEVGFDELGKKLDAASLNGETPRVKNISKKLGDPEDVLILSALVEAHKRRAWLLSPLLAPNNNVLGAVLWIVTAAALATLNTWVHSVLPVIP